VSLLDYIHEPDGMVEKSIWDGSEEKLVVHRTQNVDPVLAQNKVMANSGESPYNADRSMKHVARIPRILIEMWMKQGINFFDENDWPKIERMLNSNEYLWLRTGSGCL
jgi:hypothetical protein